VYVCVIYIVTLIFEQQKQLLKKFTKKNFLLIGFRDLTFSNLIVSDMDTKLHQ